MRLLLAAGALILLLLIAPSMRKGVEQAGIKLPTIEITVRDAPSKGTATAMTIGLFVLLAAGALVGYKK